MPSLVALGRAVRCGRWAKRSNQGGRVVHQVARLNLCIFGYSYKHRKGCGEVSTIEYECGDNHTLFLLFAWFKPGFFYVQY